MGGRFTRQHGAGRPDNQSRNHAPTAQRPPTRKPPGRFLALDEIDAFLARLGFRDRLIVPMFCSMGFRPGERFALRWNDIEEERVRGEAPRCLPIALVFPASTGQPISGHNYERDVIVPAAIRGGIMAKPPEKRRKAIRCGTRPLQ